MKGHQLVADHSRVQAACHGRPWLFTLQLEAASTSNGGSWLARPGKRESVHALCVRLSAGQARRQGWVPEGVCPLGLTLHTQSLRVMTEAHVCGWLRRQKRTE